MPSLKSLFLFLISPYNVLILLCRCLIFKNRTLAALTIYKIFLLDTHSLLLLTGDKVLHIYLQVYSNLVKLTFRAGVTVQHEFYSIETILGKEKLSISVDVPVFKFSYTPCMNHINFKPNIKTSRSLDSGKIFKHPFCTRYFHYNIENKWHSCFIIKAVVCFISHIFSFNRTILDYSKISKIKKKKSYNFMFPSFSKWIYRSHKLPSKLQGAFRLTSSASWIVFSNYHTSPKIISLWMERGNISWKRWGRILRSFLIVVRHRAPKEVAWEIIKLPWFWHGTTKIAFCRIQSQEKVLLMDFLHHITGKGIYFFQITNNY